jgi:CHAT domain-containing protein/tetratricopeptide (TPR) repeat protein
LKLLAVPPFHLSSRVYALVPALLTVCLACSPGRVALPSATLTPAPDVVEWGRPVERILGGGDRRELRVAVEAGWYVRLEIEQIGVDVAATLLGPDGATLFSADDPDGLLDREILALIAPATEELRLVLTPRDPRATPGTCRVTLAARRPAGPGDAERAAAQKALSEAGLRLGIQDEAEKRHAISFLREAVRLWGEAGEPGEQVDALNEIGTLELSLAEAPAALVTFERSLAVSRQAGDPVRHAKSLNNLAVACLELGEQARALAHYQAALALWKELGDTRQQGVVLYGIGAVYRNQGNLDEALRHLSEALPLRRAAGDFQGELRTLTVLAGVQQSRGEMQAALDALEQALELSRSVGEDGEMSVLSTYAQFRRNRGELGDAQELLLKARDYYRRTGNGGYEARVLTHLGTVYRDLGDLDESQRSFEDGIRLVAGRNPEGEAHFLNNLGLTLYLRNDLERALAFCEQALVLARQKNLPAVVAQALGQIGAIHVALGRSEEGLRLLEEELGLRQKNGDRAGEARSLLEIGRARQALGDLDPAAASFGEALALGRQLGNTGLEATCLYRWALLDRQRGDLRQALARVEQALAIIESVRSQVTGEKLRITFLASKRAWYELYIDLRMRLEEAEPGRGHAAAALWASERARARGLLDLIAEGRIDVQEGIAPALKAKEKELGASLSWIQQQIGEPESIANPDLARALRTKLDVTGQELERLGEEIRRRHPHYAEVRYPAPLRLEQIQGLLDERTALLEYFVGEESSYLFAVTRRGLSAHRLPGKAVLAERVRVLRDLLEDSSPRLLRRFQKDSAGLYALLLGPVAAELARTPELLISPDGPLYLVPFEALLTDAETGTSYKSLPYLLHEHAVSYIPSASVLDGLREPRPALAAGSPRPKGFVAFGDPVLAVSGSVPAVTRSPVPGPRTGPGTPWAAPELPGSGREVTSIASLYPASEVALYLREAATEVNVKANPLLLTARRIHFATHGFVDEASPQLSGLLLTRGPGDGEDGRLQVYEIFNLRLNADLVALSACETGLGEEVSGEGMIGLTRAFLYAGARSLLVSLWLASDQATPDLMTAFYRHLEEGEGKAEALREAKRERIARGDDPSRWALFVLTGDSH